MTKFNLAGLQARVQAAGRFALFPLFALAVIAAGIWEELVESVFALAARVGADLNSLYVGAKEELRIVFTGRAF